MTIRLLIDGRGSLRRRILDETMALAGDRLAVALHFGDADADFHAACLPRMEVRQGRIGHLLRDFKSRGAVPELLASPDYQNRVAVAVDQLHRSDATYNYRSHDLSNLQDYLDYYHILTQSMAARIAESGATHAVFMNMPHLAYDTMLYQTARSMGLQTLVLCQTTYSDRFFSMQKIGDMGWFDPAETAHPPLPIEQGAEAPIFFMDDRWQKESPRGRISRGAVASYLKHLARRHPARLLRPDRILADLQRINDAYGGLPDWRDPFARFFNPNDLPYFETLAQAEQTPVNLEGDFLYVPLHNQPEMSTSALGGVFRDQLLMIETLHRHLPEGWKIYVKENPRQNAFARGPLFWHRLQRLPNVVFLPSHAATHQLSRHARLTAAVAGTAGWEALVKGRAAVIFGGAWYGSFPGVHRFAEGMDLAAIAASTFPHADLEHAAGQLVARSHPGVIELLYSRRTRDLDEDANAKTVAQSLVGLIEGSIPTTFKGGHGFD